MVPVLSLSLTLLFALPSEAWAAEAWRIGPGHEAPLSGLLEPTPLPGGWQLTGTAIEGDQVVLRLGRGQEAARVELSHPGDGPGDSAHFLMELEALSIEAPALEALRRDLLARLRSNDRHDPWEAYESREPMAAGITDLWIPLHILLLVFSLGALGIWVWRDLRQRGTWRSHLFGLVMAALGGWLVFAVWPDYANVLGPSDATPTVMQEGLTSLNIRHLYGDGAHVGGGFAALAAELPDRGLPIRRVWEANELLQRLAGVLLLLAALALLRHVWLAVAVVVVVTTSFLVQLTGGTEGPGALLAVYTWIGVLLGAAFNVARTRRERLWCALGLLTLTLLLAGVRPEWTVVGGLACAVAGLRMGVGDERLATWDQRMMGWLGRHGRRPRVWLTLTAFVVLAASLRHLAPTSDVAWTGALMPLNPAGPTLLTLVSLFYLPAATVLFLAGMVFMLAHWRRFFLLPLALVTVYEAYYAGAHDGSSLPEMIRYAIMLTPLIAVSVLAGAMGLEWLATRWSWPRWWQAPAVFGLVFLSLGSFAPVSFLWAPSSAPEVGAQIGVQQIELRYLLDRVERYPQCAFVAQTSAASTHSQGAQTALEDRVWHIFGARQASPQRLEARALSDPALTGLTKDAPCVLQYWGTDCALDDAQVCHPPGPPARLFDQLLVPNRPFYTHVRYRDPIRIGLSVVRGDPKGL